MKKKIKAWVVWNKEVTNNATPFKTCPGLYVGDIHFTKQEAEHDWKLRGGKKGELDMFPIEITFNPR